MNKIPKPSKIKPVIAKFFSHGNSFLDFFYDMSRYGPVVRLPISARNYLINDANIIQHILITNADNYSKQKTGYEHVEKIVGQGVLTNSGTAWEKNRALLQPQFHTKNISLLDTLVHEYTNRMMHQWDEAAISSIDFTNEMLTLSMNISAMALLGIDLNKESHELVKHIHFMNNYAARSNALLGWIPSKKKRKFKEAREYIDNALLIPYNQNYEKVAYSTIKPLLSKLLGRDDNGEHLLSRQEFLGEAKNFFVAGHETTGNALSWTMYCILHHPYTLLKIKRELKFLGGRSPNFAELEKLSYLDAVVSEALRLFPPIWVMYRRARADDEINGYHIPAGTIITICNYYLHRNESYWPKPRTFSPERFIETSNQPRPKCAYLPFGSGPRVCIGKQFAMMNMKIILATILQRYEFKFPKEDYYIRPLPLITLKPQQNIKLMVMKTNAKESD